MCARSTYNWMSKYRPLSAEDLMEEFRREGSIKVSINKDTGLLEQLMDVYMTPGYGESDESIACESYEMVVKKEDMHIDEVKELFDTITDYPKHSSQVDMTGDKEIVETDVSADYDCAIGFDWKLKDKSAGLWREFSGFEKLMYSINKAKKMADINKLWDIARYMVLSPRQEKEVDRLCQMRIDAAKEASSIKYFGRMLAGAYTIKALLTTARKIKETKIKEGYNKNWLRAMYKVRLYQINRDTGWRFNWMTKVA